MLTFIDRKGRGFFDRSVSFLVGIAVGGVAGTCQLLLPAIQDSTAAIIKAVEASKYCKWKTYIGRKNKHWCRFIVLQFRLSSVLLNIIYNYNKVPRTFISTCKSQHYQFSKTSFIFVIECSGCEVLQNFNISSNNQHGNDFTPAKLNRSQPVRFLIELYSACLSNFVSLVSRFRPQRPL